MCVNSFKRQAYNLNANLWFAPAYFYFFMIIKIFCDLSFGVIETDESRESISVSDNGSITYRFDSAETSIELIYGSFELFKLDTERSVTIKWLAMGVCGMPLQTKKEAQGLLSLAPVV